MKDKTLFIVLVVLTCQLAIIAIIISPLSRPRVTGISFKNMPQIRISFSRPMNKVAVESAIKIDPPVEYRTSWAQNTLFLTPGKSLSYGRRYTITVGRDAMDIYNNFSGSETRATFETRPYRLTYLNHAGDLFMSDIKGTSKALVQGKHITEYSYDSKNDTLAFSSNEGATKKSVISFIDLQSFAIKDIAMIEGWVMGLQFSSDGRFLYYSARDLTKQSEKSIYITDRAVYKYDITKGSAEKLVFPDNLGFYTQFWLLSDNKTLLVNDSQGQYFFYNPDSKKAVLLGTFADYGGVQLKNGTLVFTKISADNGQRNVVLYNGSFLRVTPNNELAAVPAINPLGQYISYSFIDSGVKIDTTSAPFSEAVTNIKNGKKMFEISSPSTSYEIANISPDDKAIGIEEHAYNPGPLTQFPSTFRYISDTDNITIGIYDIDTKAVLLKIPDAHSLTWLK